MANTEKGLIYYKREADYNGDYTKNCGLTGSEIDGNFHFLRGMDINTIKIDKSSGNLILTRFNGDEITVTNNGESTDFINYTFSFKNGFLGVEYPNGAKEEINVRDFLSLKTSNKLTGDGSIKAPFDINPCYLTGTYKPVKKFINLVEGANYPANINKGDRFVTKEYVNECGYFYTYDEIVEINEELQKENKGWRVPYIEDWNKLLNFLEDENNANHGDENDANFETEGKVAGKLMKSENYWTYFEPTDDKNENIPQNGSQLSILPLGGQLGINEELNDFGNTAILWSISEGKIADTEGAICKKFDYDKSTVAQVNRSKKCRFPLRLVKDSNSQENDGIICILGTQIEVISINDQVWTKTNVSLPLKAQSSSEANISLLNNLPEELRNLNKKEVFLIGEWDGYKWNKIPLTEGDSVVITENGMHEWRLVGGELSDTASLAKTELANSILGEDAINVEKEGDNSIIKLKINEASSNVTLSNNNDGLKAEVEGLKSLAYEDEADLALFGNVSDDYNTLEKIEGKIKEEASTARTAEQTNAEAISTEAATARTAEQANAEAISTETATARAAEQANAEAISSETAIARAAEQANAEAISSETAIARAAEQANAEAISSETAIARAAEQANAEAISSETAIARAAEQANAEAISNEAATARAAELEITKSIKVKDIAEEEKVISLSVDGKLSSTLTLALDAEPVVSEDADNGKKFLRIKGIGGETITKIDAAGLLKDGMLQSGKFNAASNKLVLTLNLDNGKTQDVEIDVASLVDTYTAGDGIGLNGHEFSVSVEDAEGFLTQTETGVKLAGVQTAISTAISDAISGLTTGEGAVAKNTTEIASLKEKVGEKTVSDQIDEKITGLDLANTYAGKEYEEKVSALENKVGEETVDSQINTKITELNLNETYADKTDTTSRLETLEGNFANGKAKAALKADDVKKLNIEGSDYISIKKATPTPPDDIEKYTIEAKNLINETKFNDLNSQVTTINNNLTDVTNNLNSEITLARDNEKKAKTTLKENNDNIIITSEEGADGNLVYNISAPDMATSNNLKLQLEDNKIKLQKDDDTISNIDISNLLKDRFLKNVELLTDEEGHPGQWLKFTWNTDEGGNTPMYVNVDSLIDIYDGANGIILKSKPKEGAQPNKLLKVFEIKLDASSEPYLSVSDNGLKISGIDKIVEDINTLKDKNITGDNVQCSIPKDNGTLGEITTFTLQNIINSLNTKIKNLEEQVVRLNDKITILENNAIQGLNGAQNEIDVIETNIPHCYQIKLSDNLHYEATIDKNNSSENPGQDGTNP